MKIEKDNLYNKEEITLPKNLTLAWNNIADLIQEYEIDSVTYYHSSDSWTAYKKVYYKTIGYKIYFDQSDEIYALVSAYNLVFKNKTEEDYNKGFRLDSVDGYEEADRKLKAFVRKKCKIDKDVKIFFGRESGESLYVRLNS